jgi:hypothetical protein
MPRLAERQGEFAAALLDPQRPVPAGCVGPDGKPDDKRFAVYRNNVMSSLTEALRESFPAVYRLVGEEYFRALAPIYIAQQPPASPVLLDYGATFPDFLARFEPLASLPYLSDVARIENAWLEAYHAEDATALAPRALAPVSREHAANLCFTAHPSLRVVRSPYPALTIWRMSVAEGIAQPVDLTAGGEDALILRAQAEVEVRAIPQGAAELLTALAAGSTLGEAAAAALQVCPSFDLASHLTALLDAGLFIDYRLCANGAGDHHGSDSDAY